MHDIRFVEDDWENPTVGAWGLGWEVWCDGMEVSQFTYFQQVGGLDVRPVSGELTYGLERLAMYVFGVDRVYDLPFNDPQSEYPLTYGDVFLENEKQQSAYNFEHADTEVLQRWFSDCEKVCKKLLALRKAAAAAGLRAGAEGQPHLQPARRARRDLADRAPELHRPRARSREGQCRGVGGQPALAGAIAIQHVLPMVAFRGGRDFFRTSHWLRKRVARRSRRKCRGRLLEGEDDIGLGRHLGRG